MASRLQGGTMGLLSALDSGRLDPLSAVLPEDRPLPPMSGAKRREVIRRERRRLKFLASRLPF